MATSRRTTRSNARVAPARPPRARPARVSATVPGQVAPRAAQRREHGLGFLPVDDPRDQNYPLSAALPPPQMFDRLPEIRQWPMFKRVLNQGQEGTCVGHAWKHWMMCAPVIQTTPTAEPRAVTIYDHAIDLDEWPENDDDDVDGFRSFGTSNRAAAKYLQSLGYLGEYRWPNTFEETLAFLRGGGPLVLGTAWLTGMENPGPDGIIRPTGSERGGHAYLANYINLTTTKFVISGVSKSVTPKGLVGGPNSWDVGWGKKGHWRMWVDDFRALMEHPWSEAVAGLELRLVAQ